MTDDRPIPRLVIDADTVERLRLASLVGDLVKERDEWRDKYNAKIQRHADAQQKLAALTGREIHELQERLTACEEQLASYRKLAEPSPLPAKLNEAQESTNGGTDDSAVNALINALIRGSVLVRNSVELYGVTRKEIEAVVDAVRERDEEIARMHHNIEDLTHIKSSKADLMVIAMDEFRQLEASRDALGRALVEIDRALSENDIVCTTDCNSAIGHVERCSKGRMRAILSDPDGVQAREYVAALEKSLRRFVQLHAKNGERCYCDDCDRAITILGNAAVEKRRAGAQ